MTAAAISLPAADPASGLTDNPSASTQSGAARRIRALNDRPRRTFTGGLLMVTAGVQTLTEADRAELVRRVQTYDDSGAGNDAYGEHDFGRVIVGAAGYFWKIDYYDAGLSHGSPDPDETVTRRVITIMREDEY